MDQVKLKKAERFRKNSKPNKMLEIYLSCTNWKKYIDINNASDQYAIKCLSS